MVPSQNKISQIRKRDGRIVDFDQTKITMAIFRAMEAVGEKDEKKAKKLSDQVVKILNKKFHPRSIPAVEEIQDIVEEVLIRAKQIKAAKAYILYRDQHAKIRELKLLVDSDKLMSDYLDQLDWRVRENSNMAYSLQGLNNHINSAISSHYWLNKVYPPEIRDAYLNGDFHIHDLQILAAYTYFGKETVIVKDEEKDQILNLSFEQLYGYIDQKEVLLNKAELVYAKYPKNLSVLDRNGWTKVKRVIRKAKNRDMYFIKNEGGRSVIVTDNHPMIVGENIDYTTEAKKIKVNVEKTLTVDLKQLLLQEKNLFSKNYIYLAEELYNYEKVKDFFLEGLPVEEFLKHQGASLRVDGNISINNTSNEISNKLNLTSTLGYLVGIFIAEGSYSCGDTALSISVSDKKIQEKIRKAAYELGFRIYERKKENKILEIKLSNATLVRYVFKTIFNIQKLSKNKTLPKALLMYNKNFVKGVIAGLIDGDGSYGNAEKTVIQIRTASRTMLEQAAAVTSLLGLVPRDRNVEGVGSKRVFQGKEIIQNFPLYGLGFRIMKLNPTPLDSFKYQAGCVSSRAWRAEGAGWHKILNKEKIEIPDEWIYDITTESKTLIVNGMWCHNCCGWDLRDLLIRGFGGVSGKIESKPARHLRSALGHIVNFFYTLQGEVAGAQAFANFDTLLAPFIRYDGLSYKDVKQALQEFVFNVNVPTRVGFQTPFTNITMDLNPPRTFAEESVIIGGEPQKEKYKDFQKEMDMFNRAFAEVMIEGDAKGRVFSFPIPTYNITSDFEWDRKELDPIWEMTAKYGIPYFANFVNSDMKPEDARSMCCRLRLDNRELRKRGGGLFAANPLTGCYDEKTEILTKDGWKLFKDLTFDDEVFTLTDDNKIELHKPQRLFVYDYQGEMYQFKTKSLDLLVTPNHRMVVDQGGKRKFVEAENFDPNNQRIPKQSIWYGEEKEWFILPGIEFTKYGRQGRTPYKVICDALKIKMDVWLKFFGFWLAEGSTDNEQIAKRHGYRIFITQVSQTKRKEIKEVLDDLPFHYYEEKNNFVICNKQLWTYLRQFGNKYQKFIPKEIKCLSKRQLKILFDWMVKGDGHVRTTGQINYWTSSKKLADDLQEVILKLGWLGTLTEIKKKISVIKGRKIKARIIYVLGVQKAKHYRLRKNNIKKVYYQGKVYCCEVENHTVFVRRNGRVSWCGNSIGVVTINMPRIGYLSKTRKEFFDRLAAFMDLAKKSLEIKREVVEKLTDKGLYPYCRYYLMPIKERFGEYWRNHFNTIGLIGMNEACLNFLGKNIASPEGHDFARTVLDFMRERLMDYQLETNNLYNLEATPGEGTAYNLARKDKEKYPDIIVANEKAYREKGAAPYYTNSTHLPVDYTDDFFEALRLQDDLQVRYTGGTVLHGFLGERLPSGEAAKNLVRKIANQFHLPYFSLTPTFSICPKHGYLAGEHHFCPKCDEEIGYKEK
jgi:anaerobic ribonucleoside-triphosphate reductase/intein/homing endonuclease